MKLTLQSGNDLIFLGFSKSKAWCTDTYLRFTRPKRKRDLARETTNRSCLKSDYKSTKPTKIERSYLQNSKKFGIVTKNKKQKTNICPSRQANTKPRIIDLYSAAQDHVTVRQWGPAMRAGSSFRSIESNPTPPHASHPAPQLSSAQIRPDNASPTCW